MNYEKTLKKIKDLQAKEAIAEEQEIECLKRYHAGFKDGLAIAESFMEEEGGTEEQKKYFDDGFVAAIEMLCMKEFGVDASKTRANTKNGICRNAAKLIRESLANDGDNNKGGVIAEEYKSKENITDKRCE